MSSLHDSENLVSMYISLAQYAFDIGSDLTWLTKAFCFVLFSHFVLVCFLSEQVQGNWATTRQNVSSGVSDYARYKPACATKEAS